MIKLIKKTIKQKIKNDVESNTSFKPLFRVIRLEIPYIKK